MEIEHVSGVCLTSGGTLEQQGEGTVCHRVLGEIIIDNQHIFSLAHEVLAHGRAGIGGDILHRCGLAGGGGDDDGVVHGAMLFQRVLNPGHSGCLLADGHIDADHILSLLVEDRVHRNGGLAGLAVADDQLPLAPADGDHGVDGQDTGLQGNIHRLPGDHAAGLMLNGTGLRGLDGAEAVNGLAQHIHHTADQTVAYGHVGRTSGAAHHGALLYAGLAAQQHDTHTVPGQVHHHALDAGVQFHQFTVNRLVQTIDGGDAVAHLQHSAGFAALHPGVIFLNLLPQDGDDFFGIRFHAIRLSSSCRLRPASAPRTLLSYVTPSSSSVKPPRREGSMRTSNKMSCL